MLRKKSGRGKSSKIKIGIMGLGMVGGAIAKWYEKQGHTVLKFDPPKNLYEDVNQADYIFVCVPTPYESKGKCYDVTYVMEALRYINPDKIVILKSTVDIGGTRTLNEMSQFQLILLFNPEFLREKYAYQDFVKPERQILGYTCNKGYRIAKRVMKILPKAPYQVIMASHEAEAVKIFGNNFLALKVAFNNQFYDYIQKRDFPFFDYNKVMEVVGKDSRIGSSHLQIFHNNFRGYGGACFPKDSKALLGSAKIYKIKLSILKAADKYNDKLIKLQSCNKCNQFYAKRKKWPWQKF